MSAGGFDRQGSLIRQLQGALGGKARRSGTAVLTWPGGSQVTNAPTVTHGLRRTPTEVVVSVQSTPVDAYAWTNGLGSATFGVAAKTSSAAPAAGTALTISWEVRG